MKANNQDRKELVLEVRKDGFRRLIYRTRTSDGSVLFLEESDLMDFSRPMYEDNDFNVFFTERAFWKSFVDFTSTEGLLNRQVWHQSAKDWLSLTPVFIHDDIKSLVQESLAEATREIETSDTMVINGIRNWLRKLASSTEQIEMFNTPKKYRHAV